jgi:hypothetical protein
MDNSETLTLTLSHEISSVITAMRYNSKWAVVPKYYVSVPQTSTPVGYSVCVYVYMCYVCLVSCTNTYSGVASVFVHYAGGGPQ